MLFQEAAAGGGGLGWVGVGAHRQFGIACLEPGVDQVAGEDGFGADGFGKGYFDNGGAQGEPQAFDDERA